MQNDALEALHSIEAELEKRLGARAYAQLRKALRADWGAPLTPDSDLKPGIDSGQRPGKPLES